MTSFAARYTPSESFDTGHVRVQVFAGPDEEHRANCGTLVMRPHEAQDFLARFTEARAALDKATP